MTRLKRGVFTAADAEADDIPPWAVARAAHLRLARATARLCPRAALSHASAAISHGLPAVCALDRPCLTVPAGTALRTLADVHLHRASLAADAVVDVDGYVTTSAARTVLDLAREHGVDAGVAAADAALAAGLMDRAELEQALQSYAHWPGRAAARATVELCDARAESALESLSRLRMRRFGVPTAEPQVDLGDPWGRHIARVDLYWPQFGVFGEADGNDKYDRREVLVDERRRQAALEDLGLLGVRWEWRDLARFDVVVRRLLDAFARGIPAGQGQRWSILNGFAPAARATPRP